MSKSKLSLICIVILLAMPLMALGAAKGTAPTISSISPATATAGGAGFVLTVTGSNFTFGSVVRWNGSNLTTTYVSASQLQAPISSALISAAGTAQITVFTSGRGGGTSNGVAFTVAAGAAASTASTSPLAIATTSVPAGTLGTAYSATLAGSGGTSPYAWSISGGALPSGLALSAAGAISGTPTTSGTYSFTAQLADSASHTATQAYSLAISTAPLAIVTTSVPIGTAGTAYSAALSASGGAPPHGWSISGGALPPGLSMSSSGAISGTPAASGSYSFTAQATDAASSMASHTYSLTVGAAAAAAASTGPVFQDGFESGSFAAWGAWRLWSTDNATIAASPVHGGAYSAQFHYVLCGDATNTACGASTQDVNRWISTLYSPGLTSFYFRGYVYFKSPEADGTRDGIMRKLLWLSDETSAGGGGGSWQDVLTSFSSSGVINLTWTQNGSSTCGITPVAINNLAALNYDTWYSLEMQIELNAPGQSNGIANLWVNGVQVMSNSTWNHRGNCSTSTTRFAVGFQAQRAGYAVIDEYRYWDDIVVSTSFIQP